MWWSSGGQEQRTGTALDQGGDLRYLAAPVATCLPNNQFAFASNDDTTMSGLLGMAEILLYNASFHDSICRIPTIGPSFKVVINLQIQSITSALGAGGSLNFRINDATRVSAPSMTVTSPNPNALATPAWYHRGGQKEDPPRTSFSTSTQLKLGLTPECGANVEMRTARLILFAPPPWVDVTGSANADFFVLPINHLLFQKYFGDELKERKSIPKRRSEP
ncbi:hypothetical protein R3P38DRAFT_2763222 [Favolaschia claudopus]|uniref:Uncharacterized protein n=1 Tax=Favolaschia claudopus TaxID=2862362 RepID=A0AAW0DED4_9AGAR